MVLPFAGLPLLSRLYVHPISAAHNQHVAQVVLNLANTRSRPFLKVVPFAVMVFTVPQKVFTTPQKMRRNNILCYHGSQLLRNPSFGPK